MMKYKNLDESVAESFSFGFIVPTCIHTEIHLKTLDKCIVSIRNFYPKVPIIIIRDFTSKYNITKRYDSLVILENNTPRIPADMLVYYFFKLRRYFKYMIYIQDSMELVKPFEKIFDSTGLPTVQYLWHATNHIEQWREIKEPLTGYNLDNNIKTHHDLIEDHISKTITNQDFQSYCSKMNSDMTKWSVCFGCLTIMNLNFIDKMDKMTEIINIMMNMQTNRDRRAIESIFSMACQYTLGSEIHESYGGLYYDGKNPCCNLQCHTWNKISHDRSNQELIIRENLVLITSVCYTPNIPLSYSKVRSVFTPKERFEQLLETIESIREKIPDSFIFLVEYSPFTEEESNILNNKCNHVENLWDTGLNLDKEIYCLYKGYSERFKTLHALKVIYRMYSVDKIFKISARYKYTDNFIYEEYNNDMMCFYKNPMYICYDISTCGYKICKKHIAIFIDFLENTVHLIESVQGSYEQYISIFVSRNMSQVKLVPQLGIEGKVSVCGSYFNK